MSVYLTHQSSFAHVFLVLKTAVLWTLLYQLKLKSEGPDSPTSFQIKNHSSIHWIYMCTWHICVCVYVFLSLITTNSFSSQGFPGAKTSGYVQLFLTTSNNFSTALIKILGIRSCTHRAWSHTGCESAWLKTNCIYCGDSYWHLKLLLALKGAKLDLLNLL